MNCGKYTENHNKNPASRDFPPASARQTPVIAVSQIPPVNNPITIPQKPPACPPSTLVYPHKTSTGHSIFHMLSTFRAGYPHNIVDNLPEILLFHRKQVCQPFPDPTDCFSPACLQKRFQQLCRNPPDHFILPGIK